MMQASAYGRLGGDPREIATRTDTRMATASMAVDVSGVRTAGEDAPPLWLGIVAFGRVAETLLRHDKGDLVSVSGRVQRNRYVAKDGAEREQLQIVADTILSARTVRPSGGRKRADGERTARSRMPGDPLPAEGVAP